MSRWNGQEPGGEGDTPELHLIEGYGKVFGFHIPGGVALMRRHPDHCQAVHNRSDG